MSMSAEQPQRQEESILDAQTTLTSNNLIEAMQSGKLPKTDGDLYDFVALLGSTHEKANWREESSLAALAAEGVNGYTPRMADWDPSHSKAEAAALNNAAVIGLRLENKDILNGSVESIVEWGFAILSAKLNGQRLIVSIESGFEQSLTDPSQKAQFEVFKGMMEDAKRMNGVSVEEWSDLNEFNAALIQARQEQRMPETARKRMTKEDFQEFYEMRRKRLTKTERQVTLGGSSGAMGSLAAERFRIEQDLLLRLFGNSDDIAALNSGAHKEVWDAATNDPTPAKFKRAHQMEKGEKQDSDILMWVIQGEAVSLSAVVEIGFLMTQALLNGQQVAVLVEDFDADAYVQNQLFDKAKIDESEDTEFTSSQTILLEIEKLYVESVQKGESFGEDVLRAAVEIIQRAQNPNLKPGVAFNEIKKNALLKKTSLFAKADTAQRARGIAKEQFALLQVRMKELTGETENEPFILATDFTDYMQKLELIKNPELAKKRVGFWENFGTFKQTLESLQERAKAGEISGTQLVDEALNAVNPRETRFPGLTNHLGEITPYAGRWGEILKKHPHKDGKGPFLSDREMYLIKEVVAPLHDILKFLGSSDQQATPDHEILIAYVIGKYFPDLGFSEEDVRFMAAVVGDHENIFKEKGRDTFARSDSSIDRGKSFFFVMDTLTGVVDEDEQGVLQLNVPELRKRFTDLYFRHIDPEKGKTYRPEWGQAAISDFVAFFEELQQNYGLVLAPDFIKTIVEVGAIEAINLAQTANKGRSAESEKRLSDAQMTELDTTKAQLRQKFLSA